MKPKIKNIPPISLKDEFRIERKTERAIKQIRKIRSNGSFTYFFPHKPSYKNQRQQQSRILTLQEDVFYSKHGKKANGEYIYVVDNDFNFIVTKGKKTKHHSYLANGKKVRGAGIVSFEHGKLKRIDNFSGHYRPTLIEMMPLYHYLKKSLSYSKHVKVVDYSRIEDEVLFEFQLSKAVLFYNKPGLFDLYIKRNMVNAPNHPVKRADSDRLERRYSDVQQHLLFATSQSDQDNNAQHLSSNGEPESESNEQQSISNEEITVTYLIGNEEN